MTRDHRLIEAAFPLKQVSLDSVHEKNVRHGHISTLHIWPARRPLAASRAALLATLLPDPGNRDARRKLLERMAGRVVEAPSAGGERVKEETRGGIFHWGREGSGELARFREEIREAFGGRAPRVLDPFAGGGGHSAGSDAARGARRWRRTSTRWRGSSCAARFIIRACWPGRCGRCRRSRWVIGGSSRGS